MSMEISSNYSGYYIGTFYGLKQESVQSSEIRSDAKERSKDKVEEYYQRLCKKFPQISFNTNGGALACNSSKVIVNLSYECLKKMADDPEFAKEVEWNLSGEAAANSQIYACAKRDGVEIGGRTVTYDANGNRQSSCGGMRTANAGSRNISINKLQKKYQSEEDRYLKARKKREEREKLEERMAERRKEREEYLERRTEDSEVLKKYYMVEDVNRASYMDANV